MIEEISSDLRSDEDLYNLFADMAKTLSQNSAYKLFCADNPHTLRIGFACIISDQALMRTVKIWTFRFSSLTFLSEDLRNIMYYTENRSELTRLIPLIFTKGLEAFKNSLVKRIQEIQLIIISREWLQLADLAEAGHECVFARDCLLCIEKEWSSIVNDIEKLLAEQKAKKLLNLFLNKDQQISLEKDSNFIVKSPAGNTYRIQKFGVVKLQDQKEVGSYCIVSKDRIPIYDTMLAKKLLIETNEEEFTKIGIYTSWLERVPATLIT